MQYTRSPSDELLVYKNVPYISQDKKMSCWFACAEMLFLYRRPNAKFKEHLASTAGGREVVALYERGISIETETPSLEGNLERWALLTEGFGMRELKPVPRTFRDLICALEEHGPLWCAGLFFQGSDSKIGHIVVIVGAFRRKTTFGMKDYVIFHDPAPMKFNGEARCIKQWDVWIKKLYNEHETNGESPIMYLDDSAIAMKRESQPYSGLGVGRKESVF